MASHPEQSIPRTSDLLRVRAALGTGRDLSFRLNDVRREIESFTEFNVVIELIRPRFPVVSIVVDTKALQVQSQDRWRTSDFKALCRYGFRFATVWTKTSACLTFRQNGNMNSLPAMVLVIPFQAVLSHELMQHRQQGPLARMNVDG